MSILKEQNFRESPIRFVQIAKENLKIILKEFDSTKNDLQSRNVQDISLLYTIKTSEESYSGESRDKFLNLFESGESLQSVEINLVSNFDNKLNRFDTQLFLHVELQKESAYNYNNRFYVMSADETWVSNTFIRIRDKFNKFKKSYNVIYSMPFEMLVQLSAVFVIFAVSAKVSILFENVTTVPYPQLYAFIALFLLGSNLWTFGSKAILNFRGSYFPAVGFEEITWGKKISKFFSVSVFPIILIWGLEYSLTFFFGWRLKKLLSYFLNLIGFRD